MKINLTKRKFTLSTDEMITILTALKEMEFQIETTLPAITFISDSEEENNILLTNIKLLEDGRQLQADFCYLISGLK